MSYAIYFDGGVISGGFDSQEAAQTYLRRLKTNAVIGIDKEETT